MYADYGDPAEDPDRQAGERPAVGDQCGGDQCQDERDDRYMTGSDAESRQGACEGLYPTSEPRPE